MPIQQETGWAADFIAKHGLCIESKALVPENPNFASEAPKDMAHWCIVISNANDTEHGKGKNSDKFSMYYSQGSAYRKKIGYNYELPMSHKDRSNHTYFLSITEPAYPKLSRVLESLQNEFRCTEDCDFEEFCDQLGGNPDSIRELNCFNAILSMKKKFKKAFGQKVYEELMSLEME